MARTSKESQGSIFPSSKRPRSNGLAVAGSSLLWAWGFMCYLSPTLFPDGSKTESVGLEIGFFISQACIVASACLLLASPALRRAAAVSYTHLDVYKRQLEHWHTGSMTRRIEELDRALPEAVLDMHPDDAVDLGIKDGDEVRVSSPHGVLDIKVSTAGRTKPCLLYTSRCV